jgi:glutathione S-transferase
MRVVFWALVRTPEAERDMAAVARARDAAARLWTIADAQLDGRDHIAGGLTIADMALGGFLHRWYALPIERPDLPRLRGWYERLLPRGPYARHVAVPLS